MRLSEGIVVDKEKTFGLLKFSAMRREVFLTNEDGTPSKEVKERTYDLKSKQQGMMIQVSIPGNVPLKEYAYNAEVDLVDPVIDTVAIATYRGADVNWYMKADDIVLKNADKDGVKEKVEHVNGQKIAGGQATGEMGQTGKKEK